jgi:hypothetical protein
VLATALEGGLIPLAIRDVDFQYGFTGQLRQGTHRALWFQGIARPEYRRNYDALNDQHE